MGAIHSRAWRSSYAGLLPKAALVGLDPDVLAGAWRAAVTSPPSPRHRLLVATATNVVTGFAALAPAEDPDTTPVDAEVLALEVDPAHRGAGHGSRLLNAVADTARELGFRRLLAWVPEPDTDRAAFLVGAGAAADGARRVRSAEAHGADVEAAEVAGWAEIRLVAELTDLESDADADTHGAGARTETGDHR
jgi:GNAT superfamily N-acetyltransferase